MTVGRDAMQHVAARSFCQGRQVSRAGSAPLPRTKSVAVSP